MKQRNKFIPMNIQFFAESDPQDNGGSQQNNSSSQQGQQSAPPFDFEKLANIVSGKQSVTEDTVLKRYFEQQGLSKDEMAQAITAFKEQKAKNTPDMAAVQAELAQAQKAQMEAAIDKEALLIGLELGLDVKSIPYVAKLADMSKAVDKEGKISNENIKAAMSKVLEDLPQLKPADNPSPSGFKVGSTQGGEDEAKANEEKLRRIFGLKNN